MVVEYETIAYRNVVWHTYDIHVSQFEMALEDFNEKLTAAHLTVKGPLFYVLYNIPFDERMLIDIYMPVEQSNIPKDSDLTFQSYFYIDQMLMTRVKGQFASDTEKAYDELFRHVIENDEKISSPIFHILRGDEEIQWVEIKIKVFKEEEA
ncbi:DUF5085 family protein [Heyndrickxia acidiproducens]|uniref:DUF5085 family protein n=1 Tax=Heyndrickxia acidiproducens TaxID=1121084 RepID=UPI000379FBA2|nr:DUF5085 family protein [Heyndrickxia acidiproducens]